MTVTPPPLKNVTLEPRDLADLRYARSLLENPGLAVRLASLLGAPIEKGFSLLPANWSKSVHTAVHKALRVSLRVAATSLRSGKMGQRVWGDRWRFWPGRPAGGTSAFHHHHAALYCRRGPQ
jgi:hypothetical protein